MKKVAPYVVLVRDLPCHRAFDVQPAQVAEWLKGLPMRDALGVPEADADAGSGHAELDFYADGDHAFASGSFDGHLVVACSRCVGPVCIDLAEKLRITFMPPGDMPQEDAAESEDGAEVREEDVDTFAFDGERIDVEPVLREQFVLAVPYAPLCREDCKGLCSQCGIDKNTSTCECEAPIDPRLAALKDLKLPR
jgi:uncharacterized metal-binding protein YceD (DUF177 family)